MDMKNTHRLIGLDAIRSLAIFSVIAGHFFSLNTHFMETILNTKGMFIQGFVHMFFCSTGVPLFIMITGYLNIRKVESNRTYYKGMKRVLISYMFFSIITTFLENFL